jgi:hypothetical protein
MKYLLALTVLFAGCSHEITGGRIIGKRTKLIQGFVQDTTCYVFQLDREGSIGEIEVTEKAWNQAMIDMQWPFEVK